MPAASVDLSKSRARPAARGRPAAGGTVRPGRWLVLFHQIPPEPHYLRVRIGRRLRRLGAIALKNAVYVLPESASHRAELERIRREIAASGGDAVACEARFVSGLDDRAVEDRFRAECDGEYEAIAEAANALAATLRRRRAGGGRDLERLRRRFDAVAARDAFGARGRAAAQGALSLAEDRLQGIDATGPGVVLSVPPRGATWVTRTGVMVDRVASAWLIRRFIDPEARFKFVPARGYRPARGELRFDMAGAEFTHDESRCTFEMLVDRFGLRDPALGPIAEIVHELDLRDGRFARLEAPGVERTLAGLALRLPEDAARLAQGATVFEGLYQSFRGRDRRGSGGTGARGRVRQAPTPRRRTS